MYQSFNFRTGGNVIDVHIIAPDAGVEFDKIKVVLEHNTVTLVAEGDCCSASWFEAYPENDLHSLIGRSIDHVSMDDEEYSMEESGVQECDKNYVYAFHLDGGDVVKFLLRNSSNGYYGGYIQYEWRIPYLPKIKPSEQPTEVVIVVGLPASGKTNYIFNRMKLDTLEGKNIKRFDEALTSTSDAQHQIQQLVSENDAHVIYVADALFTDSGVYKKWVCGCKIPRRLIRTVLFENNESGCMYNNRFRNRALANDISRLTQIYNPHSSKYINPEIIPVYSK